MGQRQSMDYYQSIYQKNVNLDTKFNLSRGFKEIVFLLLLLLPRLG